MYLPLKNPDIPSLTVKAGENIILNLKENIAREVQLKSLPTTVEIALTNQEDQSWEIGWSDILADEPDVVSPDVLHTLSRELFPYMSGITLRSTAPLFLGEIFPESLFNALRNFPHLQRNISISDNAIRFCDRIDSSLNEDIRIDRFLISFRPVEKDDINKFFGRLKKLRSFYPQAEIHLIYRLDRVTLPFLIDSLTEASRVNVERIEISRPMFVSEEEGVALSLVPIREEAEQKIKEALRLAKRLKLSCNFRRFLSGVCLKGGRTYPACREIKQRLRFYWSCAGQDHWNFTRLIAKLYLPRVFSHIRFIRRLNKLQIFQQPHNFEPDYGGLNECGNPWHHLAISPSGKVFPCRFGNYIMGSLSEQPIAQIWNNLRYQMLRESLNNQKFLNFCKASPCTWRNSDPFYRYYPVWLKVPRTINAAYNEFISFSVTIKNESNNIWPGRDYCPQDFFFISLRILNKDSHIIWRGPEFPFEESVRPGHSYIIFILFSIHLKPGRYSILLDWGQAGQGNFSRRGIPPCFLPLQIVEKDN